MNIIVCHRHEINNREWDDFIKSSPQYIIYGLSGYLDSLCSEWKAIIAVQAGKWVAVMPVNQGKKFGVGYSLKPPFAQYLGIFFSAEHEAFRKISFKRDIVEGIITAIPGEIKLFNHNFNPGFDSFLPFVWNGFKVQPFNNYCLDVDRPLCNIYTKFSTCIKNRIRKAEKLGLKCVESDSVSCLSQILLARNIISTAQVAQLEKLWQFIKAENKGFVLHVINPVNGQIYCGGAFIKDSGRVILLASALNFRYKETGANSMMVWCAIQKAVELNAVKIFDFTGSMIRGVENYIRSFGAEPVLYFNIRRNRLSLPYSVGFAIKEKIRKHRIVVAKNESV